MASSPCLDDQRLARTLSAKRQRRSITGRRQRRSLEGDGVAAVLGNPFSLKWPGIPRSLTRGVAQTLTELFVQAPSPPPLQLFTRGFNDTMAALTAGELAVILVDKAAPQLESVFLLPLAARADCPAMRVPKLCVLTGVDEVVLGVRSGHEEGLGSHPLRQLIDVVRRVAVPFRLPGAALLGSAASPSRTPTTTPASPAPAAPAAGEPDPPEPEEENHSLSPVPFLAEDFISFSTEPAKTTATKRSSLSLSERSQRTHAAPDINDMFMIDTLGVPHKKRTNKS